MRVALIALLLLIARLASAQSSTPEGGFIGHSKPRLEIDDCPVVDPSLEGDALRARAREHYLRGGTLYVQGDYEGAVSELIAAYCMLPVYTILKDVGQAYERSLEYEKAVAYLERYIESVPDDAKAKDSCATDPQEDKANVDRRVNVLRNLAAKIFVETTPPDARVTMSNDAGVATSRARSRQEISVVGGRYEMLVERDGYEPYTQAIEVRIGKPYTYYVRLEPQKGTLSVQVTPPDARVFLGDRAVGIGRFEDTLPSGRYRLTFEAPGRIREEREVEVLSGRTRRELVSMKAEPERGKRTLLIAATLGGGVAVGSLLGAFEDGALSGAGGLLGGAASLVGTYLFVPSDVSLGTTNLAIGAGATGAFAGLAFGAVISDDTAVTSPMTGIGLIAGATAGLVVGERYDISPGDAALFNTSVLWGSIAGTLLGVSFDAPGSVEAGLRLSGAGMGALGGILLANYFDISRRHALLIDIGGVVGGISGYALRGLIYPRSEDPLDDAIAERANAQRDANYTLAGIGIGLVAAGILTRNVDIPRIPVSATLGTATAPDGTATTTFGVVGTW